MSLTAFRPDPERGRVLDRRMQAELAASLRHIAEVARGEIAGALEGPLRLLDGGAAMPPAAFGLYYELGESMIAGEGARSLAAARALGGIAPRGSVMVMGHVGGAADLERVLRLRMGTGADKFAPITAETRDDFAALVAEGLDLLDRGLPDLAGEIRAIVHEILFAQAPAGAVMEFDGASHYQFWGLLLLNPRHHRTPLAVAEVLAHEAGHSLLFGLTIDEPMVNNPDTELYPSPLRRDPRPMDGIFHAAFVSARMAWAMEGLAASGLLSGEERLQALAAAAADRANFAKGMGVVDAHAALTETGRAVIEAARDWVEGRG